MRPVTVSVLVDLKRGKEAGGHVKCWEHFAEAAVNLRDLDLTVHFLGDTAATEALSRNVRFVLHRPALSSRRLGLRGMPAETDLAWRNHSLDSYLMGADVIHTTDTFFAMARTGLQIARRRRSALVTSIHTDVPGYTRIFTANVLRRYGRWLGRGLLYCLRLDAICEGCMRFLLRRYLRRCDWILAARAEDVPGHEARSCANVSRLRRGIDKDAFHPEKRDRERLRRSFAIDPGRFQVLYVGRIDDSKSVMTLARALRALLDGGAPVHLILVGKGSRQRAVQKLLGAAATFTGIQSQEDLPWIYASADLFAFPSRTEVRPNVLTEARASGLPVLASIDGGSAQLIEEHGRDGLLLPDEPRAWASAIEELRTDPDRRARMGRQARQSIEARGPSWRDVLEEDLLPVWSSLARGHRSVSLCHAGFAGSSARFGVRATEHAPELKHAGTACD